MKNTNLKNIKSSGFKTPTKYFNSVDDAISAKLKQDKTVAIPDLTGFEVPADYFETVESKIWSSVNQENTSKTIQLFTWKKVAYLSGIAASLILALSILFNESDTVTFGNIDTASIENYLLNQDINAYDIAPYISTEEINSENFVDTKINAADIEDYLLQNSDVERLITD